MNMSTQLLSILKKGLIIYWISVVVVALLFWDSQFGLQYILFGLLILAAHALETVIFNGVLQKHSDNVLRDKLLMMPFGFLIPAGLKAKAMKDSPEQ